MSTTTSTTTVTLKPGSIKASAQDLKAAFARAKLAGIKTAITRGVMNIEMPLAQRGLDEFSCKPSYCSWKTKHGTIAVDAKGFWAQARTSKNICHVVFTPAASLPKTKIGIREIFGERSQRALDGLKTLDESVLARAVQSPNDFSVLLSALNSPAALAELRAQDPLAGARLRGLIARQNLVQAEGGALSSSGAAALLKVSRQAIDKRRSEGKLLALELGKKGYYYPSWQFGLKGLDAVMAALQGRDPWEQLSFFLNPSAALGDRTPLEIMRTGKGDLDAVVDAAAAYGEQGG